MDNYFSNKKLPDGTGPYSCPAKGIDARELTTYVNTNEVVDIMKHTKGIGTYNEFNKYIQHNGERITDEIFEYHKKVNSCFPNICVDKFPTKISIKEMREQREAADNKWNHEYTKNKGCGFRQDYRLTK